ncbi:MAG TPA: LCP family protein [Acidimicrobiia bacterium]|nr:LCP family protein [Acidimicrobiia bacterium]
MGSTSTKRRWLIGGAVAVLALLGAASFFVINTWASVNRVAIDRPVDDEDSSGPIASEEQPDDESDEEDDPVQEVDLGRQVFLLVGSDSRADLDDLEGFGDFEGTRADVVMVLFKDGENTGLLSIPRDLLVENPCGGSANRISAMLEGCDSINGPTLLTLAVEDAIGVPVDHFALVDLEGFQEVVDTVGGYEICVENPVRDTRANLELDAGCTLADGAQTLAWMRSRRTQELTDEGWQTMAGMSDLVRNERQRTFLIDMIARIADFSSPQSMASAGRSLAPYVTVDNDLALTDVVNVAWTLREFDSGGIVEMTVPVEDARTEDGASVLLPSTPVDEIVAEYLSAAAASAGVLLGVAN